MTFCPTCGRPRTAGSRFCSGCGHEFREPAADTGTDTAPAPEAPGEATRLDRPLDATRWEAPVDATRLEQGTGRAAWAEAGESAEPSGYAQPSGYPEPRAYTEPRGYTEPREYTAPTDPAEPDPFARWFAPDPPARPGGPGAPGDPGDPGDPPTPPWTNPAGRWQSADTVYAAPARAPGYAPQGPPGYPPAQGPGYPPSVPPGPGYGGRDRRPSRGARAAFIIVVILVVLGAGGGAYAFISRSGTPAASPSATASTPAASATASARASASRSPRASHSAKPSAKPSPSPSPSLVSIAASVGSNPAAPAVEKVLSHFFGGINAHSYPEYVSALDAQERSRQAESSFTKGYGTTNDSGMTLVSLTSNGSGGGLAATVTFTSHQAASSSVDNSTCNTWTLTFYLVPHGTGYLDGAAPSGYQPKYADC